MLAVGSFWLRVASLVRLTIRLVRYPILHSFRRFAHLFHLPGTHRIARLLYSPERREYDFFSGTVKYRGFTLHVDTRSYIEWYVFMFGIYDNPGVSLLTGATFVGDVIFDVGANIETFSIPLAKATGPDGHIFSFEPNPTAQIRLRQNLTVNQLHNVTIVPTALGAGIDDKGLLYNPPGVNQGLSSLSLRSEQDVAVHCNVDTIDNFFSTHQLTKVDVIKIDVEGAELTVLEGGARTINRFFPYIYVEVSTSNLARFGNSPEELRDFLLDSGYTPYRVITSRERLIRLERVSVCALPGVFEDNWLAIHPARLKDTDFSNLFRFPATLGHHEKR